MKYIDLFAGIGGFRLGIKNAQPDWECVYSNEWDKYANSVYRKHYGECDNRDIRTVKASEIPDHDLLVGGFPCQAFSVAGKRGGFNDTRGTLFFEIARILSQKQPRLCLLENVKGLLSHGSGRTFEIILASLDELGYDAQWQVLNSKNFGVPQNRERIFIIGHLRGTSRPEVFPITGSNPKTLEYVGGILSEQAKMWLDNGKQHSRNFPQGSRVYKDSGISATLASQAGGLGAKTGLYQVQGNNSERVFKEVDKVGALKSSNQANPQSGGTTLVIPVLTPDRVEKRQNGRRFKENGDPSFTLTSQDRHGVAIDMTRREPNGYRIRKDGRASTLDANYYKGLANQERPGVLDNLRIRRLTPVECERLQGFPDDWTKLGAEEEPISDTQRYRMMGNAVTTNVVTEIVSHLDG